MKTSIEQYKPQEITLMLCQAYEGNDIAMDNLIQTIYPQLKMIASGIRYKYMNTSKTLNTTSLVNEAWLKLNKYGVKADSKKHFFCLVAKAMRHIMIDSARSKLRLKREGIVVNIDDFQIESKDSAQWFIKLDEIIDAIKKSDERISQVFELKYFLGLTLDEIASELDLSVSTVIRDWKIAQSIIEKLI